MQTILLQAADIFFLVFHTAFTLFNLFGWIFKKTRPWHLLTLGLTAASWFILGIWYGWGFCFCTEWHWQVRDALGNPIETSSYITFLIKEVTGMQLDPGRVNTVTMAVFLVLIIVSVILNTRDFYLRKRNQRENS
jgi:hypothetical protein